MLQNRLYDELAHLWPLLSPPEDYAVEARHWREVLRQKLGPGRHEILELGAGGGHNLSHLTGEFQATAVDISEKMLQNSMRLNPDVEHRVDDMRSVRLDKKFKAVLIHDAVNYMLTEADLRSAFATAAAHLDPGGVFVTSPDYFKETFTDPHVDYSTHSDGKTELTYIEFSHDPDPRDTTIETIIFFFIREKGCLRIEQDRHITGLFPKAAWIDLMEESGFRTEEHPLASSDQPGQGCLLVGILERRT